MNKVELIKNYDLYDEMENDINFKKFENMLDDLLKTNKSMAECLVSIYQFSNIEVVEHFYKNGYVYFSENELNAKIEKDDIYNILFKA